MLDRLGERPPLACKIHAGLKQASQKRYDTGRSPDVSPDELSAKRRRSKPKARKIINAELMARAEERKVNALEWKYGANLQTWLRAELDGGKRKSVRLFNGCLGLRTKPAGVHVTNPAAALSWAKEHLPAAVAERLDKAVLGAALLERNLETGEAVPFAELQPAEDVFFIK